MRQLTRAEFDALSYRLNQFETRQTAFEADVASIGDTSGTLNAAIVNLSGTIDGHFNQLSGTVNARFLNLTGSLISSVAGSAAAVYSSLQAGSTASLAAQYTMMVAGTTASDAAVQASVKAGSTASLASQYTMMIAGTSASDAAIQVSLKAGSTASLASQYTMMIAGTSASDAAVQTSLKAGVTASFGSWAGDLSVQGSISGSDLRIRGIAKGLTLFSNFNAEGEANTTLNSISFAKHVDAGPVPESIKIYNRGTFATNLYGASDLVFAFKDTAGAGPTEMAVFHGLGVTITGTLRNKGDVQLTGQLTGSSVQLYPGGASASGQRDSVIISNYNQATAGDSQRIRWEWNGQNIYNAWIAGRLTNTSPGFLDPYLEFGVQENSTLYQTSVTGTFFVRAGGISTPGSITGSGDATFARNVQIANTITHGGEYIFLTNTDANIQSAATNGNVYIRSNGGSLYLNPNIGNGPIILGYNGSNYTEVAGQLTASLNLKVAGSITGSGDVDFKRGLTVTGALDVASLTTLSNYIRIRDYDLGTWNQSTPAGTSIISRDATTMFWEGGVAVGQYSDGNVPAAYREYGMLLVQKDATVAGSITGSGDTLFSRRVVIGSANTPLATATAVSSIEATITANSLITAGDSAVGAANPAITMYRTSAGARTGTAARLLMASSVFDFRVQKGTNDTAYGAETYTDLLTFTEYGATFAGSITGSGLIVTSNAGVGSTDDGNNAVFRDSTALAQGVGGGISFQGKYTSGGSIAGGGGIKLQKSNATDGNLAFDLVLFTRPAGGSVTERLRLSGQGGAAITGTLRGTGDATFVGSITGSGDALFSNEVIVGGTLGANSVTVGNQTLGSNALNNASGPLYLQYYTPAGGISMGDGVTPCPVSIHGTLDVNSDTAKFGLTRDGLVHFAGNSIDFEYTLNAEATGYINWEGYNAGTTQFRNLSIRDGKGAEVALFQGSTKETFHRGSVQVTGTVNSTGDILIAGNPLSGTINAKFASLAAAGGLINVQKFTANGTYTRTAGTSKVIVEMVGGGGGSGGIFAASGVYASTGGGASGVYSKKFLSTVSATGTIIIGAAGIGGATKTAGPLDGTQRLALNGQVGGDTVFFINDTNYLARGGGGSSGSLGTNTNWSYYLPGGVVRSGSTATDVVFGTPGQHATLKTWSGNATTGQEYAGPSGDGGSSPFGNGGKGYILQFVGAQAGNGIHGEGYGTGGGGSTANNLGSHAEYWAWGASGSQGVVLIYEFA
jgi:hypothetical protein